MLKKKRNKSYTSSEEEEERSKENRDVVNFHDDLDVVPSRKSTFGNFVFSRVGK